MSIPNFITVLRIILVPAIVYLLITGNVLAAFWLFLLAGVSDGVDGYIAKRFSQRTVLGSYLDPLADKMLLVSIYLALGVRGDLPVWFVILVVSRDLLIVAAVILSWMMDRRVSMRPLLISKVNTAGQIGFAALVMADLGFNLGLDLLRLVCLFAVAALTALSAVAYLKSWLEHMARYEAPLPPMRGKGVQEAGPEGGAQPGADTPVEPR